MKIKVSNVNTPNWREVTVRSSVPAELEKLSEMARNVWTLWNYEATDLFRSLDPALWKEVGQNPVLLLERMNFDKLEALATDKLVLKRMNDVYAKFRDYMDVEPDSKRPSVAYFSMEYGLNHVLKIYSGGLGVLAGDYLKEASDSNVNLCAIGEIGMDLYWDKTYLKEQQIVFERQVRWALEYGLPVVIHCREAFDYIYDILKPYKTSSLRGIFHSFTGTREEAFRMLEFSNFFIGINGVVTFKKSGLPEVLQNIPLERIVLETDSPYLTPVPNRGKRNESANVKDTLLKVAEIYGNSPEEIGRITSENALKVFGMLK